MEDLTIENGIVRTPGKFEGEASYAPYYYDVMMHGGGEAVDGERNVTRFGVTENDTEKFSDLKGVDSVYFMETTSGFWCEVHPDELE